MSAAVAEPVVIKDTVFNVAADAVTAVLKLKTTLLVLPALRFAAPTVDVLASVIVGGIAASIVCIPAADVVPVAVPEAKVKAGVAPTIIVRLAVAPSGICAVIQKNPVPIAIDWLKPEKVCVPAPAPLILPIEVAPEKLLVE